MDRKTLDKAKVAEQIANVRRYWTTGDRDILKLLRPDARYTVSQMREHMAILDIVHAVIGTLKEDVTDREIFNILQILGYDIV
jgi:hypothetical protein